MAREGGHPPQDIIIDTGMEAVPTVPGGPVPHPSPHQQQVQSPAVSSPATPIPTVIADRFQVLRRIGGGSFGEIYEGRDMTNNEQVRTEIRLMIWLTVFVVE
jgi:hypothetical protein